MKKIKLIANKVSYLYLIFVFAAFFLLDFILRKVTISYSMLGLYDRIPLFFVLGWCLIFCGLIAWIPGKIKIVFMVLLISVFMILTLVHGTYINIFNKFFSFSDLSLLGEGTQFMDVSYINIRKIIIAAVIGSGLLIGIAIMLLPKDKPKHVKNWMVGTGVLLLGLGSVFFAEKSFPEASDPVAWDASSNITNIYQDFLDTPRCLLMSGLYQYTFKDLWEIINPFEKAERHQVWEELDSYFEEQESVHIDNEKTGIFTGKNLILVQLENIDEWMLTQENMPNLYQLKESGIDFTQHYSVAFATGKTFNTEFIVNTGQIPMIKGQAPSYIYNKNNYPFSLANMFRNAGYTANSFHAASGSIYNRSQAHKAFGYEKYYNFEDMGMDDYTMDSQLIGGFELMTENSPFFDFIITISAHGPFSLDTTAAQAHIDEVKETETISDDTYLAGMAQAKETDEFVGELIKKLEESGNIENTVLAFYTDHYAYSTISSELELELKGTNDPNLLQKTPFFIWSADVKPEKITKVTNTADILPTLANMFYLDLEYKYCAGEDAFDETYQGYAMFSDFSWYDGEIYYDPNAADNVSDYEKSTAEMINNKINVSWDVLESDYFSHLEDTN